MEITNILEEFLPKDWRRDFEIEKITKEDTSYIIRVVEKTANIPKELQGKNTVFNGYCDVVRIVSSPFNNRLIYFDVYRRKWKEKGSYGSVESYTNDYTLHPKGAKITQEFADFLKELDESQFNELCDSVVSLRSMWEEVQSLV